MLLRLTQQFPSLRQAILPHAARTLTTTPSRWGLEELIVVPPKEPKDPKEKQEEPIYGRAWQASELRIKSWDDLHKLWFVLLKEKNKLHSEKLMYKAVKKPMPQPRRLSKVRLSMNRIKQVLSERLKEHEDPHIRMQLKAVIDAM
ncbi:hypothetical protein N2152v2_002966 [Parachlorella kessleri]